MLRPLLAFSTVFEKESTKCTLNYTIQSSPISKLQLSLKRSYESHEDTITVCPLEEEDAGEFVALVRGNIDFIDKNNPKCAELSIEARKRRATERIRYRRFQK